MKRIALFNHKGGVGKTTTVFNLGWMLASKGKRVVMVDADPQCNLTGLVLGTGQFEIFYEHPHNQNIRDSLRPAFKAQPRLIEPVECQEVKGIKGLFLLPGHLELSEYEVTLGIAQQLSSAIFTLQNVPGSFSYLFEKTAEKYQADYVLIDMNPSLGAINQNLLMTSDYFIVPTIPDYFSIMALESMAKVLPNWALWAKQAANLPILTDDAVYPFPKTIPKFLGIIIQRYLSYGNEHFEKVASKSVQEWIDQVKSVARNKFIPEIAKSELTLSMQTYDKDAYCLAEFGDFRTLAALSQTHQIPIFEISAIDVTNTKKKPPNNTQKELSKKFHKVFSTLADKIIKLTAS